MSDRLDAARPPARAEFRAFRPIATRWMDNDVYGHVNNVVYYAYFDTAVNGYLIEACGSDIRQLPAIGVVAETRCQFLKSISFPDELDVVEHARMPDELDDGRP